MINEWSCFISKNNKGHKMRLYAKERRCRHVKYVYDGTGFVYLEKIKD